MGVRPRGFVGDHRGVTCWGPQHVIRGVPEPHDEDAHAALHATDECVLEEDREPRLRRGAPYDVLQFRSHPPDSAGVTSRLWEMNDLGGNAGSLGGKKAKGANPRGLVPLFRRDLPGGAMVFIYRKPREKSMVPQKKKLNVYIDGFNLYHAIDAIGDHSLKWLSLRSLAFSFVKPHEVLNHVRYFTAVLTWEKEKQQRHKNYIRAQKAIGVDVVESNFRKVARHCRAMNRYCDRHEEKQTDVAIAVSVLLDVVNDDFHRAVLVTADSDQIPLVKAIREHFPSKRITLAAPPNRGGEARELGAIVHDRTPITEGRIRSCALPRNVLNDKGRVVATRPALYA
jgi:uncharacterized LabA/DUF88 family protein